MTTIASKNPAQPEQKRQYQTPREFEDILSDEAEQQLSDAQQRQRHERFLEALRKAYNGDLNEGLADNTNAVQLLSKNYTIEKGWEGKANGEPIAFKNKTTGNTVFVSKDEIKHHDTNGKFEYEDAVEMVRFAMLDVDMQRDGFFIRDASPEQQALIEAAVAAENAKLPAEYQIKVRNALDPKKNARAFRKANRAASNHKETIAQLAAANGFFAGGAVTGDGAMQLEEAGGVENSAAGASHPDPSQLNQPVPEPDPAHAQQVTGDEAPQDVDADIPEGADLLNMAVGDQLKERGVWSPELVDKFGEIQSITKAVATKFDAATADEKQAFIDAGLIKETDKGTEFNVGKIFGLTGGLEEGLTLEERAEAVRSSLAEQAAALGVTEEDIATAQRVNDSRAGMDGDAPKTAAAFIVPIQKAIDPNMGNLTSALIPVHLAIRSGLDRQVTSAPDPEAAEAAFKSNFEKGAWPDDPDMVKQVMAAAQNINAIERGEKEGPINPQDVKTLVEGLNHAQLEVAQIADKTSDTTLKTQLGTMAADIGELVDKYEAHSHDLELEHGVAQEEAALGATVPVDSVDEDLPEDVVDQLEADLAAAIAEDPDLNGGADVADPAAEDTPRAHPIFSRPGHINSGAPAADADDGEPIPKFLTKGAENDARIRDAAATFRDQPFFQRNVPEADRQKPVTNDQLIAIFENNGGIKVPEEPKARDAFLSAVKDDLRKSGHLVRQGIFRKQDYLGNPRNPSA